jgi:uncharacterized protein (TIGR02271 family)
MATTQRPIAVGVFRDRALAKQAIDELRHAGFRDDEISVDGHAARAGSLLDHLASTFTGQRAEDGKLVDELVRKGMPENDASYYQQEVEAGRTVVVVESYGHAQEARDILYRFGAYDASSHREDSERIIPVREEELRIHKQAVPTGEIIVRKEIITEQKTFTVPVTHEELVIERRSGESTDQATYQGELADEVLKDGGTLRIMLREEHVRIEKQPVVKEEILISKRQIQEARHLEETLRREEAHIERAGEVNIHGSEGEDSSGETEQKAKGTV